jgi:hypothetical protein
MLIVFYISFFHVFVFSKIKRLQRLIRQHLEINALRKQFLWELFHTCLPAALVHLELVYHGRGHDRGNLTGYDANKIQNVSRGVSQRIGLVKHMNTGNVHAFLRNHNSQVPNVLHVFKAITKGAALPKSVDAVLRHELFDLLVSKRRQFTASLQAIKVVHLHIPKFESEHIQSFIHGGADPLHVFLRNAQDKSDAQHAAYEQARSARGGGVMRTQYSPSERMLLLQQSIEVEDVFMLILSVAAKCVGYRPVASMKQRSGTATVRSFAMPTIDGGGAGAGGGDVSEGSGSDSDADSTDLFEGDLVGSGASSRRSTSHRFSKSGGSGRKNPSGGGGGGGGGVPSSSELVVITADRLQRELLHQKHGAGAGSRRKSSLHPSRRASSLGTTPSGGGGGGGGGKHTAHGGKASKELKTLTLVSTAAVGSGAGAAQRKSSGQQQHISLGSFSTPSGTSVSVAGTHIGPESHANHRSGAGTWAGAVGGSGISGTSRETSTRPASPPPGKVPSAPVVSPKLQSPARKWFTKTADKNTAV